MVVLASGKSLTLDANYGYLKLISAGDDESEDDESKAGIQIGLLPK